MRLRSAAVLAALTMPLTAAALTGCGDERGGRGAPATDSGGRGAPATDRADAGGTDVAGSSAPIADSAVQVHATGCPEVTSDGVGLVVDDGLVLTAAHVVAGATSIDVSHAGRTEPGTLVAFDPRNDLAMLLVAGDLAAPIRLGSNDGSTTGSAVVFRAGAAVALPVEVVRSVNIDTTDIYDEAKVSRPGYELRVQIEAGDSGAGVIIDGKAVAVLWSRSRERDDRAWAIDPIAGGAAIRAQLAGGARPQDRCRD